MAKQTFYWPNPPTQIDTTGLATEAKQDAQIVIAQDTLTELTNFHADNTTQNTSIEAAIANFEFANTTENADILTQIQDFRIDNSAENAALDSSIDAVNTSVGTVNTSVNTVNTSVQAVEQAIIDFQTTNTTENQNLESTIQNIFDKVPSAIVVEQYDYLGLTYVVAGNGQGEIETVTYKLGGAGGTTQAVITLAYDSNNRLTSVTKA